MILSSSLPNLPTMKSLHPAAVSDKDRSNEPSMTKLSHLLQEKLSKANLSFQTIMKQIGTELRESPADYHTTEVRNYLHDVDTNYLCSNRDGNYIVCINIYRRCFIKSDSSLLSLIISLSSLSPPPPPSLSC
jgi:predicted hydrolase (HD superfamily)